MKNKQKTVEVSGETTAQPAAESLVKRVVSYIAIGTFLLTVGGVSGKAWQSDSFAERAKDLQGRLDKAESALALESANHRADVERLHADLSKAQASQDERRAFVADMQRLEARAGALDKELTGPALSRLYEENGGPHLSPESAHTNLLLGERNEVGELLKARMTRCPF
jgi:hypothetical protein